VNRSSTHRRTAEASLTHDRRPSHWSRPYQLQAPRQRVITEDLRQDRAISLCGCEGITMGPMAYYMNIMPTKSAPKRFESYSTSSYRLRLCHVFNTDVFCSVKDCCLHCLPLSVPVLRDGSKRTLLFNQRLVVQVEYLFRRADKRLNQLCSQGYRPDLTPARSWSRTWARAV